jgi:hypothetical protein
VALFSDIDWIIIAAVGLFLLFGRENQQFLRTLGRWYARAGRLKQEILGEFMRAADLPPPAPGQPLSFRGALLGLDPTPTQSSGIPAAVRVAPTLPAPAPTPPAPPSPWTGSYPVPTWTMTTPVRIPEVEVTR